MISRSDGRTFHLLLADRPVPYPNECESGKTSKLSICFWYLHDCHPHSLCSIVVVLPIGPEIGTCVFRQVESIADLLAVELLRNGRLCPMYEFTDESLSELFC